VLILKEFNHLSQNILKMIKDKLLKELGNRVSELRKEKGFTQADLAARVKKDQQSIQRLEKGKVNPSYYYLHEIAEGLEISIYELLNFEVVKKKNSRK
jgi:putative transcriptional regulator